MTLYRDLDTLPFDQPEADASPAVSTATPRRHRHVWRPGPHQWVGSPENPIFKVCSVCGWGWKAEADNDFRCPLSAVRCWSCGALRDPVTSRRGRTSLRAGKDAERAIAKAYGGTRTGQFGGPDDVVVGDLFIVQSKAGGWFSERVWAELVKLPRAGGRIPTLIVSDRPGTGHRTRRYVVRSLEDDVSLHGPVTP